jgi:hypothetical protein
MDGQPHAGKYRGTQSNPEQHCQCPARMFSHMAQAEPGKKFKKEEHALHN